MNRFLATALLACSAFAFAQAPQVKNEASTPQNKPDDSKGRDSHEFALSDLFRNSRLKFHEGVRCVSAADLASNDMNKVAARLKAAERRTCPVDGNDGYRSAQGVWKSELPGQDLMSPEQVAISCLAPEKQCSVLRVRLDVDQLRISVKGPDETDYQIISWDANGLFATHDPDYSDKCHRSVLSMSFATGEVSLSDIPTHEKGCEVFMETNSYRLAYGEFYVDTAPHNDSSEVN